MRRVFIAGPYSSGDVEANVAAALDAAAALIDLGLAPFCPHLFHFLHARHPYPYEVWMMQDAQWLPLCEAVLRLPGESPGADIEVAHARELGIPVACSVEVVAELVGVRHAAR